MKPEITVRQMPYAERFTSVDFDELGVHPLTPLLDYHARVELKGETYFFSIVFAIDYEDHEEEFARRLNIAMNKLMYEANECR